MIVPHVFYVEIVKEGAKNGIQPTKLRTIQQYFGIGKKKKNPLRF